VTISADLLVSSIKKDTQLWTKIRSMLQYVIDQTASELADVKYKVKDPNQLSQDAVKEIIKEEGFKYIVSVMDTINNFEFNTMVFFIDLINQLKGHRRGLELVLKLLGFDSIIREWWEDPSALGDPLTYEITVFVNSSFVPDIFLTLEKVQEFSRNYVLAQISNVDVQFLFERFASKAPIMAGFSKQKFIGHIIQRAF